MFLNFNESDWQNFIYLSLLLVLLFGSLASRREMPFKTIFKYLAAWSVVAFVAIILYSYRYEFFDFKDRILSEVSPSTVRIKKSGQLSIKISEDGHFYMNVLINGVSVRFMVDTGASDMVINARDAKRVGINLDQLVFNKSYQTANGVSQGASVRLDEVIVGEIKFKDVSASVSKSDMGISLLGMSMLSRFSKYEFYRDELILIM